MSVNEFIKNMAAAGFTGSFRATNLQHSYRGTIDANGRVSSVKVQTVEESRKKIQDMLHGNQANKD